jgi:hypothetical protein
MVTRRYALQTRAHAASVVSLPAPATEVIEAMNVLHHRRT